MRFNQLGRREFITLLGGAAVAWPVAALAQQTTKVPRVGFLYPGPEQAAPPRIEALLNGLRSAGYDAPAQIEFVLRIADGDPNRIAPLLAEIVQQDVDVIIANGSPVILAARSAALTIPIVALDLESDPVASGLASSLPRPGGNITGLFFDFPDFTTKWLELLKEANNKLSRVAVLWDPMTSPTQKKAVEQAAGSLNIELNVLEVRTRSDFDEAFVFATQRSAGAMLLLPAPLIAPNVHILAELALRHRLPAITIFPDFARAGGLLAYGPNLLDMYRQVGVMAGKVLKGTKPAELPIERPTRFELVINLKTAKAFGLTVPPALLYRADEVIE
jgi:putative ABC transport system substrate-binding protein